MRYCQCGCNQPLKPLKRYRLNARYGGVDTRRFINGHNFRGANNHKWVGGFKIEKRLINNGKKVILIGDHHRADNHGYVAEHILIAEKIMGKPLPPKAVIHHVNKKCGDNRSCNLVICENQAYHNYIHQRLRAYLATGNVNMRKCSFCKKYDYQKNLIKGKTNYRHRECANEYAKNNKRSKKK